MFLKKKVVSLKNLFSKCSWIGRISNYADYWSEKYSLHFKKFHFSGLWLFIWTLPEHVVRKWFKCFIFLRFSFSWFWIMNFSLNVQWLNNTYSNMRILLPQKVFEPIVWGTSFPVQKEKDMVDFRRNEARFSKKMLDTLQKHNTVTVLGIIEYSYIFYPLLLVLMMVQPKNSTLHDRMFYHRVSV